jgi:hypothetical protein
MHIQARSTVKSGGSAFIDDDDAGGDVAVSTRYGLGALSELLGVLDDAGFNLRAASGHDIELGGEFTFWADPRRSPAGDPIDDDHDVATRRAAALLRSEGFEVELVEVHRKRLDDTPGALRSFVDEVTKAGLLVREVSVGTRDPDDARVPVQIVTVAAG